jgi:hypothetical protein
MEFFGTGLLALRPASRKPPVSTAQTKGRSRISGIHDSAIDPLSRRKTLPRPYLLGYGSNVATILVSEREQLPAVEIGAPGRREMRDGRTCSFSAGATLVTHPPAVAQASD